MSDLMTQVGLKNAFCSSSTELRDTEPCLHPHVREREDGPTFVYEDKMHSGIYMKAFMSQEILRVSGNWPTWSMKTINLVQTLKVGQTAYLRMSK